MSAPIIKTGQGKPRRCAGRSGGAEVTWTQEDSMTLGELIRRLESYPRDEVFEPGFGDGHSYRGYYECLAFTPLGYATAGEMLDAARACLGQTFHGWKGGNYTMDAETGCFIAEPGDCGGAIRPHFFEMHDLRKRDATRADLDLRTVELLQRDVASWHLYCKSCKRSWTTPLLGSWGCPCGVGPVHVRMKEQRHAD